MTNEIIVDTDIFIQIFNALLYQNQSYFPRSKNLIKKSSSSNQVNKNNKMLILMEFILKHKKIYVVPKSFSEIYSLIKRDSHGNESLLKSRMEILMPLLNELYEEYIAKDDILNDKQVKSFGFTDIALTKLISADRPLLTNDYKLYSLCHHRGLNAILLDELPHFLK